jgi:hypothetical protein
MNLSGVSRVPVIALVFAVACTAVADSFGEKEDVDYAATLWQMMAQAQLVGEQAVLSKPYKGASPHGDFLDTLETSVTIDGHQGRLILTRNYGGDGVTRSMVANAPTQHLQAITVMFKREAGYDAENQDWFWSKYAPTGELLQDEHGVPLAGRVAKGAEGRGCIACHKAAPGGDMVYSNDRGLARSSE